MYTQLNGIRHQVHSQFLFLFTHVFVILTSLYSLSHSRSLSFIFQWHKYSYLLIYHEHVHILIISIKENKKNNETFSWWESWPMLLICIHMNIYFFNFLIKLLTKNIAQSINGKFYVWTSFYVLWALRELL